MSTPFDIQGNYNGNGINHEGQKFEAHFSLKSILDGKGCSLNFSAIGSNGENFHTEHSLIGSDFQGNICLFVLSNNHTGMTPHILKNVEETPMGSKKFIFGFGNIQEINSFREEIVLEVLNDNKIDYRYFWGMPGGSFAERSGAIMNLISE